MLSSLIEQSRVNKNSKILEVGCSGCAFIRFMNRKGFKNLYGIDISKKAVNLCKSKGVKTAYVMDAAKTKFRDNEFDLIVSSDILEHIKDDNSAIAEWNRILKPNGALIIFVPAFNFLWGSHDKINNHYRRYTRPKLIKALERNNFAIQRSSYWNFSLFFPISLLRFFQRIFLNNKNQKDDQLYELNTNLNKLLTLLLKLENRLLNNVNFPVGISVFAVAKKR